MLFSHFHFKHLRSLEFYAVTICTPNPQRMDVKETQRPFQVALDGSYDYQALKCPQDANLQSSPSTPLSATLWFMQES